MESICWKEACVGYDNIDSSSQLLAKVEQKDEIEKIYLLRVCVWICSIVRAYITKL